LILLAVRGAQCFIKRLQTKGVMDLREIIWTISMLLLSIKPQKLMSQHTKNPWVTTCLKFVLSNFAWVIQQL